MSKRETYKQQLTQARAELIDLLNSLTPEQLQTPVISEGQHWTPLDIAAHLLENEQAMSIHVHKIRTGRETVPEDFDLERWNAGLKKRAKERSLPELLDKLVQTRAKTFEVLDSIQNEEWALTGRHPLRGLISIEQYYQTIAGHDAWHTKDIKQGLGLL